MRVNRERLWVAIGIAVFLTFSWWGILTLVSAAADLPSVRLAHIPGSKKNIVMPPESMQRKVIALMRAGKAPKYAALSKSELERACGHENISWRLLGCFNDHPMVLLEHNGATVFIWDGLRGDDRRYVLIHEFAHAKYGWTH